MLSCTSLRCSVMEAVCGGRSVAQKPGGGTSDRGAGVQRGHASYVGALHGTRRRYHHRSTVLWSWYVKKFSNRKKTYLHIFELFQIKL